MMGEGAQRHEVTLPTFYIGRYHVTVAQFRAFTEETGVEPGTLDTLRGPANHPVAWSGAFGGGSVGCSTTRCLLAWR